MFKKLSPSHRAAIPSSNIKHINAPIKSPSLLRSHPQTSPHLLLRLKTLQPPTQRIRKKLATPRPRRKRRAEIKTMLRTAHHKPKDLIRRRRLATRRRRALERRRVRREALG